MPLLFFARPRAASLSFTPASARRLARTSVQYATWIALLAASFVLAGCGGGHSADAPVTVTATAGDSQVTLVWNADAGVDYWVFSATDPSVSPNNFVNVANARVLRNATSPQVITGLTNGTTYYFTINGRTGNGAGGPGSPVVAATPRPAGAVWTVGPSFTPNNLNDAAYGIAGFVAAGAGGQLFSSFDAVTWGAQNSTVTTDLNAITFLNSLYVAVGNAGTTVRSSDGVTWSSTQAGTQDLYAIVRLGATYVAVGANGAIVTSPNATTWTVQNSGTTVNLRGVAYSGSTYVVVGDKGTVLTSSDGVTWTVRTSGVTANLRAVTYGLGKFVAVGDAGTILTSTDGTTWSLSANPTTEALNAVVAGSQFVAAGVNGRIITSPDGVTWTIATSNTTATLFGLAWSGSGYVAVGAGGTDLSSF